MHQTAHESDIIIVNHHLFFADLAVKDDDFGGIIPEYAAVIFDEAHEIEDVAGQYFGVGVSSYQFEELIRDIAAAHAPRVRFGRARSRSDHAGRSRAAVLLAVRRTEGRIGFGATRLS